MATVNILTDPVREEGDCEIQVSGKGLIEVTIALSGVILKKLVLNSFARIRIKLPIDSAGKTLRVSVPGDFDSVFVLAQ